MKKIKKKLPKKNHLQPSVRIPEGFAVGEQNFRMTLVDMHYRVSCRAGGSNYERALIPRLSADGCVIHTKRATKAVIIIKFLQIGRVDTAQRVRAKFRNE